MRLLHYKIESASWCFVCGDHNTTALFISKAWAFLCKSKGDGDVGILGYHMWISRWLMKGLVLEVLGVQEGSSQMLLQNPCVAEREVWVYNCRIQVLTLTNQSSSLGLVEYKCLGSKLKGLVLVSLPTWISGKLTSSSYISFSLLGFCRQTLTWLCRLRVGWRLKTGMGC